MSLTVLAMTPAGEEIVRKRAQHLPEPPGGVSLGIPSPKPPIIPLHPDPAVQNYQRPVPGSKQLIASYARHVLRQPHPEQIEERLSNHPFLGQDARNPPEAQARRDEDGLLRGQRPRRCVPIPRVEPGAA